MKIKMVNVSFAEWRSPTGDLFIFSAMSRKHMWYVSSLFPLSIVERMPKEAFIQFRWAEMRHLRDRLEIETGVL